MMRAERLATQLAKMRRAAQNVLRIIDGVDEESFLGSLVLVSAVAMNLQRLGEAGVVIKREFPGFLALRPDVPWSKLIGLRHVISHDYDSLDEKALWNIAKVELPRLLEVLSIPEDGEI
jgi:uncharacterized protein with HEPN domain